MSDYLRRMSLCLVMAGLLLGFGLADAMAETITSLDFSMGYGAYWSVNPTTWSDAECLTVNTSTTQGDFTFAPAPVGNYLGTTGCRFTNRVLTDQGSGSRKAGYTLNFEVPITASYTGDAPDDADPTAPDYHLEIEITKISIYGNDTDSGDPTTMRWDETTSGHEQYSPSIDLIIGNRTLASGYRHLVWNPDDYSFSLGSLNASVTRTFDIIQVDSADLRYLEGLEIEGRVILSYDPIPEPSTVMLVLSGLLAAGLGAWRKLG